MTTIERRQTSGPLYRQIQAALTERITTNEWAFGRALPSRRELCAEYHTTRVTLDKAIRGLIMKGLVRSERGSGTFVSYDGQRSALTAQGASTRSPLGQRSLQIGVLLGRAAPAELEMRHVVDDFYFSPLIKGIHDGVDGKPVEISFVGAVGGDYLARFQQSNLDGFVLVGAILDDLPGLHALVAERVPFIAVAISSFASPQDRELPCVDTDNSGCAKLAVEHLLGLGHRRIALVNLAIAQADHLDRLDGYRTTLAAAGLPIRPEDLLLYPTYIRPTVFTSLVDTWISKLVSGCSLPTAIVATDYYMALVTLGSLRRHGIRVPEDISLVGFDDPASAAHLTPPLTTVRLSTYQMGNRAVRRLVEHLQMGLTTYALQGTELVVSELVVRGSTGPAKHQR